MNEPEDINNPEPHDETEGYDDSTAAGDVVAASVMPQDAIAAKLEALLFVHSRPVSARRLGDLLGIASVVPIKQALELLMLRYEKSGSAFTLQNLANGYQLATRPEHDDLLSQLVRQREAQKLSPATLEALAVIAYKQPIGRHELENIRGAGSDHLVRALLDRALVKVVKRDSEKPGSPALYGTTAEFLRAFGLRTLSELPQESDLAALADDETSGDEIEVEQAEAKAPDDSEE